MKGRREALAKFCLLIQIMHQRPEYSPEKIYSNQILVFLWARMDDRMGNLGMLFLLWVGMDDPMGNGAEYYNMLPGGVQQHVVVRGGVLQHAGWGSDGTEYFSSEKEYNFYSEK